MMVGDHAVALLLRRAGLQGITSRPRFGRGLPPEATAGDQLQRQFARAGPDQVWVAEIERHEVLLNRAVVQGHRLGLVAASH